MRVYKSPKPRGLELEELPRAVYDPSPLTDEETEVQGSETNCPLREPGQNQGGAVRGAARAFRSAVC